MKIGSTIVYIVAAALFAGYVGYQLGAGTFDPVRLVGPSLSIAMVVGAYALARRWARKHGGEIG